MKTCKDCKKQVHEFYAGEWCEDCFDNGLHKDMNDHWNDYWKKELQKCKQQLNNQNKKDQQS